jgi:hypothetical protein
MWDIVCNSAITSDSAKLGSYIEESALMHYDYYKNKIK